jgi:rubrerythrin
MRDYFINEKRIQAFNIQDFIAGIVYAKDQGIPVDPESAVKVGYAYEVDLKEPSVEDNESEDSNAGQSESQESNDSQESQASAEQEPEQSSESSTESSGEASDIAIEDLQAMTTQELDDFASDCDFQQFKDFANGFGVTGRSKKDMLDKLKELRDS